MDANEARFWMLAGPSDLTASDAPARVRFDARRGTWKLASGGAPPALAEDEALATALRERPRRALDPFGSEARVVRDEDSAQTSVLVRFEGLSEAEILRTGEDVSDIAIGVDGVITVASGGALRLRHAGTLGDEREDWQRLDAALLQGDPDADALAVWRSAPRPGGGAFVLDREHGQLGFWSGTPLRNRPEREPAPGTFRPRPEAPRTLDLRITHRNGFGGDLPVAIACSPAGRAAVLCWRGAAEGDPGSGSARVHLFDAQGLHQPDATLVLLGLRWPFSLAFLGEDRIALLATDGAGSEDGGPRVVGEALVYELEVAGEVLPAGERYPLRRHDGEAFLHAPGGTPRFGTSTGPRPLAALSLPRRAHEGAARGHAFDSATAGTCWHRLYVEAALPAGCGLRVLLAASDGPDAPSDDAFYAHDFGAVPNADPEAPRGAWVPAVSEIPEDRGLLHCAPEFGRVGLFTALIQRSGRRTRRMLGRYLHVRVRFFGTGHASPELAALRAWNPRFSYVRSYLPELYHEDPLLEADDQPGPATAADFLERFVSSFEGVLTPLEDRVAESWRMTHPRSAPAEALEWLASWVGLSFDPALAESVRRKLLYFAPQLARERGTRRGLERALEIVSEGGISRGEVVVVEDFRLRRTWATVLGADLADENDPVLGGLVVNNHSIVGDTLVLGDEQRREFLALFGRGAVAGEESEQADQEAIDAFLASGAHRATVLVFDAVDQDGFARIARVCERDCPAHVQVAVKRASRSFIVAVTALVGIDTRLGIEPPPASVRLGSTRLGTGDRLQRRPAMHPDLEGDAG